MSEKNDATEIEAIVDRLIQDNPGRVIEAFRKPSLHAWFVVQAMREAQGKAKPAELQEIVKRKLAEA